MKKKVSLILTREKFITKVTLEQANKLKDLTDWEHIEKMSELKIEQNALTDPDNQPFIQGQQELKRKKRLSNKKE